MKNFDEWMLEAYGETLEQALMFDDWRECVTKAARYVAAYAGYLAQQGKTDGDN